MERYQYRAVAIQCQKPAAEFDLEGLLIGVKDGSLDAAVATLTITSEREKEMDSTHPFFTSGLGIAVARVSQGGLV